VLLQTALNVLQLSSTIAHPHPRHHLLTVPVLVQNTEAVLLSGVGALHLIRHADDVRFDNVRMQVQNFFDFAGAALGSEEKCSFDSVLIR
jgi:hypothetical protein